MANPANVQIRSCPSCDAKNRVDPDRSIDAICGRCKRPLFASAKLIILTDANFAAEVERSPLPVLVDFWAAWCGPCRMVAPVIDQLASELAGKVRIGKLDVAANQLTAGRYRVQNIPTILIFRDGREADRIVGVQSKEALLQRLSRFM